MELMDKSIRVGDRVMVDGKDHAVVKNTSFDGRYAVIRMKNDHTCI